MTEEEFQERLHRYRIKNEDGTLNERRLYVILRACFKMQDTVCSVYPQITGGRVNNPLAKDSIVIRAFRHHVDDLVRSRFSDMAQRWFDQSLEEQPEGRRRERS